MEELRDLNQMANTASSLISEYGGVDFELPQYFKDKVKEINSNSIKYNQYSAIIETKGYQNGTLNIYMPNQWFYVASYFTELYNELMKYKKYALQITTKDRLKVLDGSNLTMEENRAITELDITPISKELLTKFITDYSWWGGAKTIDRGDFYVSPILSHARLVNASQSFVADLCGFLADKQELVNSILNYVNVDASTILHKDTKSPLQQIYYGAPGTGKSHGINEQTKGQSVIRTTFHPDSDYSTFVGTYKPTTLEVPVTTVIGTKAAVVEDVDGKPMMESKIVYEFVEQAFLKAYIKAWKNLVFYNGQPQYLVIEEINRGNCAQIFGDLFQLLDRNSSGFSVYPIHADNDMRKHLRKAFASIDEPDRQIFMQDLDKQRINQFYDGKDVISEVLSGEVLLLPNNLYIWATMNTSDQSLFPIDSAFKRRWEWKYVPICKKNANYQIEVQKEVDVDGERVKKTFHYDWWDFLDRVNTAIAKATSSEDKKLGYFFCKASKKIADTDKEPSIITADKFVGKVVFYLWNDVFKDFEIGDAKFRYGEDDLSLLSTKVGEEEVKREFSSFFDEKGNAKHEAVANLLDDLKIEGKEVEDGGSETKSEATAGGFLKVIFPDGHEICEPKIVETFVNSIVYIARTTGYEAISELGIIHDGLPILSKIIQNTHAVRSIGDNKEWRLLTGIRHDRKAEILQEISDKLDLGLEIVVSGNDSPAKETPERISDTNMPYRVTFSDGTVICIGKGWDTYVATLRKIGLDKALPYGEIFSRKNKTLPLITTKRIPDDGIYKYYDVDGYYVLSGTDSQHRLLKRMNKDLNLGLTIE